MFAVLMSYLVLYKKLYALSRQMYPRASVRLFMTLKKLFVQ
jgi:hypothetical protein